MESIPGLHKRLKIRDQNIIIPDSAVNSVTFPFPYPVLYLSPSLHGEGRMYPILTSFLYSRGLNLTHHNESAFFFKNSKYVSPLLLCLEACTSMSSLAGVQNVCMYSLETVFFFLGVPEEFSYLTNGFWLRYAPVSFAYPSFWAH